MAYFYVKPKGNIHHLMVDDAICPNAQWRSDLEFSFFFSFKCSDTMAVLERFLNFQLGN